ncbi:amidohydrolase family protein [Nisaea denitrificans]|uniref:amidohydrolase family protein n=1 Tax=Nisaea denitrificans TaxID=390877 RepID=UPI00040D1BCD|nr:amidohydrolase family protein [Nisaea denitrificans]
MRPIDRRQVLALSGGLAATATLPACIYDSKELEASEPAVLKIVDAHAHIFNASDLPSIRFLKIVFLERYPELIPQAVDLEDPDIVDGLIWLLTFVLGRASAPSASEEIDVLEARAAALAAHRDTVVNDELIVDAIAASLTPQPLPSALDDLSPDAPLIANALVFQAAGLPVAPAGDDERSIEQNQAIAALAYRSETKIGRTLRWFRLFTRYRYVLVDQLSEDHRKQRFESIMVCPALIDYDFWLGEHVTKSTLEDQVLVMGHVARRQDGPAVHGYVAYDPLRRALYKSGYFEAENLPNAFDPLELVSTALNDHGFAGVKLYPPMGFRPFANTEEPVPDYQVTVLERFAKLRPPSGPGSCDTSPMGHKNCTAYLLDEAMSDLFELCIDLDVPILSHATNSNSAAKGTGDRGDPYYWARALEKFPKLRVLLGHFGRFNEQDRSAGAPGNVDYPEATWEWTIGRFIRAHPDAQLYADISFLSEIGFVPRGSQKVLADCMRRWCVEFDPECHHLVFGTDWTMLGRIPAYDGYTSRIYDFFESEVGFSKDQLERLFRENAIRFLGLDQRGATRSRLLKFYERYGLGPRKLPYI